MSAYRNLKNWGHDAVKKVGGGIGDFATKIMGSDKNDPAKQAMPFLEKAYNTANTAYDPYIQRGNQQYDFLNKTYGEMSDPASFLEKMMAGYSSSPQFQQRRDEALAASRNSAAAGGRMGTLGDMQDQGRIADSMMTDDMQQYLQNVLGIQGAGLQGKQGFYNQGLGATESRVGDLTNILGTQANLRFQGQSQRNQHTRDLLSSLMKFGGMAMGGMGGGAAAGGASGGSTAGTDMLGMWKKFV